MLVRVSHSTGGWAQITRHKTQVTRYKTLGIRHKILVTRHKIQDTRRKHIHMSVPTEENQANLPRPNLPETENGDEWELNQEST